MSAKCPSCGNPIDLMGVQAGSPVQCPTCHKSFRTKENRVTARQQTRSADVGYKIADETKDCPFCSETIKFAAIKCRHCGSNLQTPSSGLVTSVPAKQDPLYDQDVRESTLFEGSASQWTNLATYLFCCFMALIAVVLLFIKDISGWIPFGILALFGLIALAAYINVRFSVYRVTSERIEVETGWISKQIDHMDLFRMKDIRLKVGILDRLFGIGNVIIVSRDESDPVMCMKGLPDPRPLYDRLKKEAVRADRRRGVVHIES